MLSALLGESFSSASNKPGPMQARLPHLIVALLESPTPEELQVAALQAVVGLKSPGDSSGAALAAIGAGLTEEGGILTPHLLNTALLRVIQRRPLLCLDVLGAFALEDHFRSFFSTNTALRKFLARCCEQPDAVVENVSSVSRGSTVDSNVNAHTDPLILQRSAARCLANLSANTQVRQWARSC